MQDIAAIAQKSDHCRCGAQGGVAHDSAQADALQKRLHSVCKAAESANNSVSACTLDAQNCQEKAAAARVERDRLHKDAGNVTVRAKQTGTAFC